MSSEPSSQPGGPSPLRLGILISIIYVALAVVFSLKTSATTDEAMHYGAGLSYLALGDYRLNPEHPPLPKYLWALPVYVFARPPFSTASPMRVEDDVYGALWDMGVQQPFGFFYLNNAPGPALPYRLLMSRAASIGFGLLAGWMAFFAARRLGGGSLARVAAMAFLFFYPEFLGHSTLMTHDVPFLATSALAAVTALRWWRRPMWQNGAWLAAACVLAGMTKSPAYVYVPLMFGTLLGLAFLSDGRVRPRRVLALLAVTCLAGYGAVWLAAGFRWSVMAPHLPPVAVTSPYLPPFTTGEGPLAEIVDFLARKQILPQRFLATVSHVAGFSGRPMFLLGEQRTGGWWYYFLVTIALKSTPAQLAGLGALLLAGARSLRKRTTRSPRWSYRYQQGALLLVPYGLLFLATCATGVNFGHRLILFVYFPFSVMLGLLVEHWWQHGGPWRMAGAGLLAAHLLSTALAYPHFSTYFNVLAGGDPYAARVYLRDSNTDWGQDMPLLTQFLRQTDYDGINIAAVGANDPDAYAIAKYQWIAPDLMFATIPVDLAGPPLPHWPTAISVNLLEEMRLLYPGRFDGEPDVRLNSFVVYLPEQALSESGR